jgi:hypothetical protein
MVAVRNKFSLALCALSLLVAGQSVWAHHSPSAEFDMDHKFTLTGVLAGVDWINPHVQIHVDAKDAAGKVANWSFESNPPLWFKRAGVLRQDIAKAVGQTVTVEGLHARNGSNYGYFLKITFADGTTLEWNSLLDQAFGGKQTGSR